MPQRKVTPTNTELELLIAPLVKFRMEFDNLIAQHPEYATSIARISTWVIITDGWVEKLDLLKQENDRNAAIKLIKEKKADPRRIIYG